MGRGAALVGALVITRLGNVADHTFNPWSAGAPRKRTSEANWRKPLKWNRERGAGMTCYVCNKPAACFGVYEDPKGQGPRPACGACCGHGCEDGWCKPIEEYRPRVSCSSLAEWLDPEVPAEWLADLLALIEATPHLDWLLLTKRPELWRERLGAAMCCTGQAEDRKHEVFRWLSGKAPPNVWVGTSVEDQQRAEERIPHLLQIPARVRFLSCEPLLGPVELGRWLCSFRVDCPCGAAWEAWQAEFCGGHPGVELVDPRTRTLACPECERCVCFKAAGWVLAQNERGVCSPDMSPVLVKGAGRFAWTKASVGAASTIHWVIVGGESGPGARPMHPAWARSLRDQCQEAGVPFHFKQWGAWVPIYSRNVDPDARALPNMRTSARRWLNVVGGHGFHGDDVVAVERVGKKIAGRELDGRTWNEVPS